MSADPVPIASAPGSLTPLHLMEAGISLNRRADSGEQQRILAEQDAWLACRLEVPLLAPSQRKRGRGRMRRAWYPVCRRK